MSLEAVTWMGCFLFVTSGVSSQAAWGESITIDVNDTLAIEYIKYSTSMSWSEAASKCGSAEPLPSGRRHLLCFENRDQVLGLFPPLANLTVWLGQRNCHRTQPEQCLSLNVTQSRGDQDRNWQFQFKCDRKLGFICRKFIFKEKKEPVTSPSPPAEAPQQLLKRLPTPLVQPHPDSQQQAPASGRPCPRNVTRGVVWPETLGHTKVSVKCPDRMKGFAEWRCNGSSGVWGPGRPNLSKCRSLALEEMLQKIKDQLSAKVPAVSFYTAARPTPRINLTETALNLQRMMSQLETGGDVTMAVDILDRMEDIYMAQAPAMSPAQKRALARDTSRQVLSTCDQLLTKSEAWMDLDQAERYQTATKFLRAVDETGRVIATTLQGAEKEDIHAQNLVLEVVKVRPGSSGQDVTFSDLRVAGSRSPTRNSVTLTLGPEVQFVVFALYADLTDILPTNQEIEERTRTLQSSVMSANISHGSLQGQAQVTLQHSFPPEDWDQSFDPVCVWWDVRRQVWNGDGCVRVETSAEQTTCLCDHLTNFAVLVDASCTTCSLALGHKVALAVITIVGCTISIFCLSVCIVLFSFFRSLWGMRIMIHRNLCICLLIAQILLLGGLDRTENKAVCGVIAGLLHYFFLGAFCWMFLEAFHIMWLLVKVFTPKQSHGIAFYLFGYGCPAVVVAITAGSRPDGYGTPQYCWLSTEDGTIWGYLGPVLAIILFNTLTLGYALITTHRIIRNKEKVQLDGFKMWVRGATVLTPLLGVTWVVGFLYLDSETVVFAYIFALLNSLQGLGIFLFHCLLNKKVTEHVSRSWKRSSMRRSTGTVRSSTRNTSSKSSSGKSSASPKRPSKFFVSVEPEAPSSPETPEERLREETVGFLQPPKGQEGRERFDTGDLYPLEVEK